MTSVVIVIVVIVVVVTVVGINNNYERAATTTTRRRRGSVYSEECVRVFFFSRATAQSLQVHLTVRAATDDDRLTYPNGRRSADGRIPTDVCGSAAAYPPLHRRRRRRPRSPRGRRRCRRAVVDGARRPVIHAHRRTARVFFCVSSTFFPYGFFSLRRPAAPTKGLGPAPRNWVCFFFPRSFFLSLCQRKYAASTRCLYQ